MRGKGIKLDEPCPKVRLSQDRLPIAPLAINISMVRGKGSKLGELDFGIFTFGIFTTFGIWDFYIRDFFIWEKFMAPKLWPYLHTLRLDLKGLPGTNTLTYYKNL